MRHPRSQRIGFYCQASENRGVEYLSAFLKRAGHETRIFFDPALGEGYICANRLTAALTSVEDMLIERMAEAGLDIAAFSVTTQTYAKALRVAQKLKERVDVTTVFGGIHVSCAPEAVAKRTAVDYAIVGEGEEAMVELVDALALGKSVREIRNLCFRDNGSLVLNPLRPLIEDLDTLPFPDTDLFWNEAEGFRSPCYVATASRGCPASTCTYCCNSLMKRVYRGKGRWHRRRSVDNMLAELESAVKRYRFKRIQFWDDDFVDDAAWLEEFAENYPRRIGLPFFAFANPWNMNPRVAALLKQAGCCEIIMGLQTLYESTRKRFLGRFDTNRQVIDAFNAARDAGLFLSTCVILELPGQSLQEVRDMVTFFTENPVDMIYPFLTRYFPGTRLVDLACEEGLLTEGDVTALEQGEWGGAVSVAQPYDRPEYLRIRHMIVLTTILPKWLIAFLIRNNRYERLPLMRTTHCITVAARALEMLRLRKRHIPITFSLLGYAAHCARFMRIRFRWKLSKFFGRREDTRLRRERREDA